MFLKLGTYGRYSVTNVKIILLVFWLFCRVDILLFNLTLTEYFLKGYLDKICCIICIWIALCSLLSEVLRLCIWQSFCWHWFSSALLACSKLPCGALQQHFAGCLSGLGSYMLWRSFGLSIDHWIWAFSGWAFLSWAASIRRVCKQWCSSRE